MQKARKVFTYRAEETIQEKHWMSYIFKEAFRESSAQTENISLTDRKVGLSA